MGAAVGTNWLSGHESSNGDGDVSISGADRCEGEQRGRVWGFPASQTVEISFAASQERWEYMAPILGMILVLQLLRESRDRSLAFARHLCHYGVCKLRVSRPGSVMLRIRAMSWIWNPRRWNPKVRECWICEPRIWNSWIRDS